MVMAYNVVFVIYQVAIVLLLFMPNVNCQVWSDLKHFLKAWLDLLGDKLSYENQIWKATSVDCYEVTYCPFWLLELLWALQMQLKLCSITCEKLNKFCVSVAQVSIFIMRPMVWKQLVVLHNQLIPRLLKKSNFLPSALYHCFMVSYYHKLFTWKGFKTKVVEALSQRNPCVYICLFKEILWLLNKAGK